jgi:hypothetical protein
MDLTTARTNLKAQSLYASLGWVQDDVFLSFNRRVAGVGGYEQGYWASAFDPLVS